MRKKPFDRDHDHTSKRFLLKSILMASCLFLMLAAMVLPQCTPQARSSSEDQIQDWVITEDEIQSVFGVGIYYRDSDNYRAQYWVQIINSWDWQIDNALAQGGIEPSSVRAEVLSAQWQLKNSVMLNVHVISFWQDPKADVIVQKLSSRMPVYKGISPSVPGATLSLDQQRVDIGDYAFLSTEQVKGWTPNRALYLIEFVKGYVFADVIGSGEHIASQLEQLASILASKIPPAPGAGATGLTVTSDVKGVVVDGVTSAKIQVKLPTTERKTVVLTADKTIRLGTADAVNGEVVFQYVPDLEKLGISLDKIPKDGYPIELTASTTDGTLSGSLELQLYRRPVIFVHGLWSNHDLWNTMGSWLEKDGFDVRVVDYGKEPAKAIDKVAMQEVADMILRVKVEYRGKSIGITKVDTVGHSMGGLALQYYIAHATNKGEDIFTLIMIGTPHDGSPWPEFYETHKDASWAKGTLERVGAKEGEALQQLKPGSLFLQALNKADLNPDVRYYNIIGTNNDIALELKSACDVVNLLKPDPAMCKVLDPMLVPGDGVVSIESQQGKYFSHVRNYYVNAGHWTLQVPTSFWSSYTAVVGEAVHPDTYSVVRQLLLEEDPPVSLEKIKQSERIIVTADCPVVLSAYDASGNALPLNVEQPPEGEPVAYSWEENDILYLTILNGSGDYVLVAEGKEAGTFSLTIVRSTAQETVIASHGNVDVQPNSRASVTVGDQSSYSMKIDRNGDGTLDETIPPTSLETIKHGGGTTTNGGGDGQSYLAGLIVLILVMAAVLYVGRRVSVRKLSRAPATVPPAATVAYCEDCGRQIPAGNMYCPYCGDKQGV